jgi:hypothetical protein
VIYSTPFRRALGYPLDSCSAYPPMKDLMHVLMRREIEPLFFNTVRSVCFFWGNIQRRSLIFVTDRERSGCHGPLSFSPWRLGRCYPYECMALCHSSFVLERLLHLKAYPVSSCGLTHRQLHQSKKREAGAEVKFLVKIVSLRSCSHILIVSAAVPQ